MGEPMVMPHVWANMQAKEKKASAAAVSVCETGRGASVGNDRRCELFSASSSSGLSTQPSVMAGRVTKERGGTHQQPGAGGGHHLIPHPFQVSGRALCGASVERREEAEADQYERPRKPLAHLCQGDTSLYSAQHGSAGAVGFTVCCRRKLAE